MSARSRRGSWAAGGLLLLAVVPFVALWRRHPSELALWPVCPSKLLAELHCPGCGSSRALHHLLQLDFGAALRHNALFVVIGVPVMGWMAVELLHRVARGAPLRPRVWPAWTGWVLLVAVILFTLLRNLPFEAMAALRPPP